jgi:hypothetical protein
MLILTGQQQEDPAVRAIAGLLLKNSVREIGQNDLKSLKFIQQCSLASLGDPLPLVRGTIGIVITTLLSNFGVDSWPELLPSLLQILDQQQQNQLLMDGAFACLAKVCEDSALSLSQHSARPLDHIVPRLIQFAEFPRDQIREYALECLNSLVAVHADALFSRLNDFSRVLSLNATNPAGRVRKLVCSAFVMLLDSNPEYITGQLQGVAQFMFHAMQDQDEQVALEACEFWLAFADHEDLREFIRPFIPQYLFASYVQLIC